MNEEFSFLKEKIKEKPFYKRKSVKIVLATICLAVLFGLISCAVFVKAYPWFTERAASEEVKDITIPEDSPEEQPVEDAEAVQPEDSAEAESPEEGEAVVPQELTLENYSQLYTKLRLLSSEISKSMVMVTAVRADVDWFNEAYENAGQISGLIIGDNGLELLVLTEYDTIKSCDGITVSFYDNAETAATLKKYDLITNLAVIGINLNDIPESTRDNIQTASLGSSVNLRAGIPVIALGMADGSADSMKIGTLTSADNAMSVVDGEYTLLNTDMYRSSGANGFLINMDGNVIGILQDQYENANMKNTLTAYAISDMKSLVEHLSNNQDLTYLGVTGATVTSKISAENEIPQGVYVTEVEMDSPAMVGGIQIGDIITEINGQEIARVTDISSTLKKLSNKQMITIEGKRQTNEGYKAISYSIVLGVLE